MRVCNSEFILKSYEIKPDNDVNTLLRHLEGLKKKHDWDKEDIKRLRKLRNEKLYKYTLTNKRHGISCSFTTNNKKLVNKLIRTNANKIIDEIKKKRKKEKKSKTCKWNGIEYLLVGNVHNKSGEIRRLEINNPLNDPIKVKTPKNGQRYIGIELEFNNIKDRDKEEKIIADAIKKAKLGKYCNIVREYCGHELRCLIPENELRSKLSDILKLLNTMGFNCDRGGCGTHIHLDMRDRDTEKAYSNLYMIQDVMFKLVPSGRRSNRFCQKNNNKTWKPGDDHESVDGGSNRYKCINTYSYDKFKTLEVRLHHGTLKFREIYNWIKFILKTIDHEEKFTEKIDTIDKLASKLKLRPYEINTLQKRYKQFNTRSA